MAVAGLGGDELKDKARARPWVEAGVGLCVLQGSQDSALQAIGWPSGVYIFWGLILVTELEQGSGGVLPHNKEPEALRDVGTCSETTR